MSLLKTYGSANMIIEEGLAVRYELNIRGQYEFVYRRIATKKYSYHGMTKSTANRCYTEKSEKYRLKNYVGNTIQIASCVISKDIAGYCVTVTVNDNTNTAVSPLPVDDPSFLFYGFGTVSDYDEEGAGIRITSLDRIGPTRYRIGYASNIYGLTPGMIGIEIARRPADFAPEFYFAPISVDNSSIECYLPDDEDQPYGVRIRYGEFASNSVSYVGRGNEP